MPVSQGTVTKSYVSATEFLDQRDIDPNIYDQSRDRSFTDIMRLVNRTKPATMYSYHNFTNQDVYETATISSVTSGFGTAQIVIVINSSVNFPRMGDLVTLSGDNNIGVQGRIQAAPVVTSSTASLTIRSVGGNSAPFFPVIGQTVSFGSNAAPEKSDTLVNRRYGLTKYYNLIQAFREVDEISDVQKVARIEVNVGGDYGILPYQLIQKKVKLEADISYQMLAGVQSSTQFSDANPFLTDTTTGLPVQTTGGLDWYVRTYGIPDQAPTLGTFGWNEVDEMIDNWIANKAPTDQMGFMGSRAYGLLSKFFKNLGSSGVTSVRLNIDGRTMDFEVERINYRGYNLEFVHIPIFDHPQLFSSTIRPDINGSIFWVPKDQVDTMENGRQPRIQIRYTPTPFTGRSATGFANGMVHEWRTGALAEISTSSVSQLHTDFETYQGLECIAVKHFQKYRVI